MLRTVSGADYMKLECEIDSAYAPPLKEALHLLSTSLTSGIGRALGLLEMYDALPPHQARLLLRPSRGGDKFARIAFDPKGTLETVGVNVSAERAAVLQGHKPSVGREARDSAALETAIGLLHAAALAQSKGGVMLGRLSNGVESPLVIPADSMPKPCSLKLHSLSPVIKAEVHHLGEYPWDRWQHLCVANVRYCLRGCGWRSAPKRLCQRIIRRLPDQQ